MKRYKKIIADLLLLSVCLFSVGCTEKIEETSIFLTVDQHELILEDGSAGSVEIIVSTNAESYTANVEPAGTDWLSVETAKRFINVIYKENLTGESRSAEIQLVAGNQKACVEVTQSGKIVDPVTSEFKVGDLTKDGKGIIYYVTSDGKGAKAISINRTTDLAWSSDPIEAGASSLVNGASNASHLDNPMYKAQYWCKEMGEGWYLPARDEMTQVFEVYNGRPVAESTIDKPGNITSDEKQARAAFDAFLVNNSGDPMNSDVDTKNGNSYWTSTEYAADPAQAYFIRFGKYVAEPISKSSTTRYIRCVKVIGQYQYPDEPVSLDVKPASLSLDGDAATEQLDLMVKYGNVTTVEVNPESSGWCSATPSENKLTISVTRNTSGEERHAEVKVIAVSDKNPENKAECMVSITQKAYVDTSVKIGDIYKENGNALGIVFWIADDGNTAKILSLDRSETTVAWSTVSDTDFGASNEDDGLANTNLISTSAAAGTIPALDMIKAKGEGWYWPSINELIAIFEAYNGTTFEGATINTPANLPEREKTARAAFDKVLTDNGGLAFNTASASAKGDQYWASTECAGTNFAMYLRVGSPYKGTAIDEASKTGSSKRYVRLIKSINLK